MPRPIKKELDERVKRVKRRGKLVSWLSATGMKIEEEQIEEMLAHERIVKFIDDHINHIELSKEKLKELAGILEEHEDEEIKKIGKKLKRRTYG